MKEASISGAYSDMLSSYRVHEAVEKGILRCRNCDLVHDCKQALPGFGSLTPEVLVVGDHPEEDEIRHRISGLSESSMFVLSLLHRLDLSMNEIHWTHAIKCPPRQVNLNVIAECRHHLVNQIVALKPTVIVAMGTTALTAVNGEPMKVEDATDDLIFEMTEGEEIPIIAIPNPKSVLKLEDKELRSATQEMFRELTRITTYID